jgi:hypothetical protein
LDTPVRLPSSRAQYFAGTPGTLWDRRLVEVTGADETEASEYRSAPRRTFRAGQHTRQSWNLPLYGPTVGGRTLNESLALVDGHLSVSASLFADRQGHRHYQYGGDAARTVVRRNGRLIASTDAPHVYEQVPHGAATYRIQQRVDRHSFARLGTGVDLAWTFRSPAITATTAVNLPVSVVRFKSAVDTAGRQRAAKVLRIPVAVKRQGAAGLARTITVQVSYDDGRTWSAVQRLTPKDGTHAVATFRGHDSRRGYVTLRATSTDTHGSTVRQTITRAFLRR